EAGETVPVGTPLIRIGEPGAAPSAGPASSAAQGPAAASATAAASQATSTSVPAARTGAQAGIPPLSPVVRRLAAEHGVDLATVHGSGLRGRITREDVERAIADGSSRTAAPAAAPQPVAAGASGRGLVPAAPPAPSAPPTTPSAPTPSAGAGAQ